MKYLGLIAGGDDGRLAVFKGWSERLECETELTYDGRGLLSLMEDPFSRPYHADIQKAIRDYTNYQDGQHLPMIGGKEPDDPIQISIPVFDHKH